MTTLPQQRATGGDDQLRVDVGVTEVGVVPGQPATIEIEVTNLGPVIGSYLVEVLGVDPAWAATDVEALDLFPEERRTVVLTVTLPEEFPAGRQAVAVQVAPTGLEQGSPAVVGIELVLDPLDLLEIAVEPTSLTVGARGTYVVTLTNRGNTSPVPTLRAEEPERLVDVVFEPLTEPLPPGEQRPVRAGVSGRRPWFGMPVVRVLTITVAGGTAEAAVAAVLVQQPRISRRLLAILGLLAVATLFAFVIMASFNNVAQRAEANEQLLRQGLGHDQPAAARAAPATVGGRVTSTTGGGIDGATVELFDPSNPAFAVKSTVTTASGDFRFAAMPAGEYLVRFEVAGFGELWYPDGESVADAEPVELHPGDDISDLDAALAGRPGSVSGVVLGADVAGALVAIRIPADAIEGSELDPAPADVVSVELDATGRFSLADLATPATYELVVSQSGFATDVRTLALAPGDQRDGIEVHLRLGDGRIAGTVVDTAGEPLGNVVIDATDGTTATQTRSLSGDDTLGEFELRDLPTPATYTLTVAGEGYFPESVTVELDDEQQRDDLQIVLTSDIGSLSGHVRSPDGSPLGGVDVTIDGAEVERTTVSLSSGDVGSWLATDLPVPGEYTVVFSREGYVTQAMSVELMAGVEASRSGMDAVLRPATASVSGRVTETGSGPIGGVTITLDSSEVERRTISSHQPAGAYRFDALPPGAYTITFARVGSRPQTVLVDVIAGQRLTLPDVALEPQDRILGTVRVDGVGEAGVGVTVYPLETYPTTSAATTVTGAGGVFEVIGLDAPQSYILEFRVPAGGPVAASEAVFLQPGEVIDLDVDL